MTREEVIREEAIKVLLSDSATYKELEEAVSIAVEALKEQRPHGEWVFRNDNPLIPTGYWECSKCKKGRLMVEENFCPNCGSDNRPRKQGCCFADETCKENPCKDCGLIEGEKK
jgi:hypothetical protein